MMGTNLILQQKNSWKHFSSILNQTWSQSVWDALARHSLLFWKSTLILTANKITMMCSRPVSTRLTYSGLESLCWELVNLTCRQVTIYCFILEFLLLKSFSVTIISVFMWRFMTTFDIYIKKSFIESRRKLSSCCFSHANERFICQNKITSLKNIVAVLFCSWIDVIWNAQ